MVVVESCTCLSLVANEITNLLRDAPLPPMTLHLIQWTGDETPCRNEEDAHCFSSLCCNGFEVVWEGKHYKLEFPPKFKVSGTLRAELNELLAETEEG